MAHQTLPYLSCLKAAVDTLTASAGASLAAQGDIASRLLDLMIVQRTAAAEFKRDCYAALREVLPRIEKLFPASQPGDAVVDAIRELQALCDSEDGAAFARCMELMGAVQRALLALGSREGIADARALVRIESRYHGSVQTATQERTAASIAASKAASAARNAREYDEQAVLAFMRQTFPEETSLDIEKSGFISGGYSKFTIGITLKNAKTLPREIVLRGDAAATFGGASVVDEFGLIKALYENGACVAKPLALETSGAVFGSPFLLAERRPGSIIGHTFKLPRPNKSVCADVAAKLAAVHRVPIAALGDRINNAAGKSSDKALEWIEEGFRNWRSIKTPSTVFETAFDWLRRNAPLSDLGPRGLVHGDYSLSNLLIHEDRVSTILDWEFAHVANPAYDLGYFHYQAEALDSWEAFLKAYANAGGPLPDERQLDYHLLLADTRLGVMVCQVANIFKSGAEIGTAAGSVLSDLQYERTIARMSRTLERVL